MKSFEFKLNLIATLFILSAIFSITILFLHDKKIGGNILNAESYKTESVFVIADKEGNMTEVTEKTWKENYILTIITFVTASIGALSFLYLYSRYVYIPLTKISKPFV